jgi:hypothetical protein
LKIVIAQSPFLGGPSEVFRIVDDQTASNTKLCHGIDSCFTETSPVWVLAQWAVTPKLTMIAGRQLSIGELSV